ncbi:MAG: hypothetical protein E7207_06355 [Clostridium butyricum]|nr:hypothetical protein [Clostridium butyricum]
MNKLVMLRDIRKESNLYVNVNQDKDNNAEEYSNFKNKFLKDYYGDKEEYNKKNSTTLIDRNMLNEALNKIFLLNGKKLFVEFVNEIFGDCLGTECQISYIYDDISNGVINDGILNKPNYAFKIEIKDNYRLFEYNIQFKTDDYENIAIGISKNDLSDNTLNVINLEQKKRQYRQNNFQKGLLNNTNACLIIVNSNIKVPDSYEIKEECNESSVQYKFEVLKSWKYEFKDLYEKKLYLLFPLKIFDLKKCISYMRNSEFSTDAIQNEIYRFFNRMNKYLNEMKEKSLIDDKDVSEFNSISKLILENIYY